MEAAAIRAIRTEQAYRVYVLYTGSRASFLCETTNVDHINLAAALLQMSDSAAILRRRPAFACVHLGEELPVRKQNRNKLFQVAMIPELVRANAKNAQIVVFLKVTQPMLGLF